MNTLICPRMLFQELLMQLLADPEQACWLSVGRRTTATDREWFARTVLATATDTDRPHFQVTLCTEPPPPDFASGRGREPPALEGYLWLGDAASRSKLWGTVYSSGSFEPLHQLMLVGPGMFMLAVVDPAAP